MRASKPKVRRNDQLDDSLTTDFGNSRPNILISTSTVAFAVGFGWLGIHTPDKWNAATGMYIVGCALPLHSIYQGYNHAD